MFKYHIITVLVACVLANFFSHSVLLGLLISGTAGVSWWLGVVEGHNSMKRKALDILDSEIRKARR